MKIEINLTKFDCDNTIVIDIPNLENKSKLTNKIKDSDNRKLDYNNEETKNDVDFVKSPDADVSMFVNAMALINASKFSLNNKVITAKQLSPLITYKYNIKKKYFDLAEKVAECINIHYGRIEDGVFNFEGEEYIIKINRFGLLEIYQLNHGTRRYLFSTNYDMLIDDLNREFGLDDDDF